MTGWQRRWNNCTERCRRWWPLCGAALLAWTGVANAADAAAPAAAAPTPTIAAALAPDVQLVLALPSTWPAAKRESHATALQQLLALLPNALQTRTIVANLPEAIADAAQQWRSSSTQQRSLIIVTSGFDGAHADAGDESRSHVLAELLPRLRQNGVRIFTIAADQHADDALLSQLAVASDGWFFPAADSDNLIQRAMIAIESIVPRDALPIEDGLVKIDDQVQSVTLLLYRNDPVLPPRLIPPLSDGFSQFNAPANVKWTTNDIYDLIVVNKPRIGTWQLDMPPNEANRAVIDAAMAIDVSAMPRNMLAREQRVINIELQKAGSRISDINVLEHLALKAALITNGRDARLWYPLDNGEGGDEKAGDGIYTIVLNQELRAGEFDLAVEVEGVSIKRRKQQHFVVHATPAAQHLSIAHGAVQLSVIPRMGMLDLETLAVLVHFRRADGSDEVMSLPRYTNTEWRGSPPADAQSIEVNVQAMTMAGQPVSAWLESLPLAQAHADARTTHAAPSEAHDAHDTTRPHEHAALSPSGETNADETHDMTQPTPAWLVSLMRLATINLVVALVAAGAWWWRRRQAARFNQHLLSVLTP